MDIKGISAGLIQPRSLSDVGGKAPQALNVGQGAGPSFTQALVDAVGAANTKALAADQATQDLMLGQGSVHQAMIAMQDSAVAMDMVVAVRNKVLDAYQEVMRMPV